MVTSSKSETTAFTMLGAREALSGGFQHIEEQIKSIEQAVGKNSGLAFDLAKTLIESTCKTILRERSIGFDDADDLPGLFKTVTTNLPLLPATASAEDEARKSLVKTLSGLHTAVLGICELRNAYGFASHGTAGQHSALESAQALLSAQAADTIIGFLYRCHRQDRMKTVTPRSEYEDYSDFNQYVDDVHEAVKIFELEYKPSEVLFIVDKSAYLDALANFKLEEAEQKEVAEANPVTPRPEVAP